MRRFIFTLASVLYLAALTAQELLIDHGPYLQCPSADGMSVYFSTSNLSFSWVELKGGGYDEPRPFYGLRDGLRTAYTKQFHIDLTGLEPATVYQYRIVSVSMDGFQPYKIKMGDKTTSPWYSFRTPDPEAADLSFIVCNDGHDNPGKLSKELSLFPTETADLVVYNGDMISYYDKLTQPYDGFIDVSVGRFATSTPFIYVRGNHETRGNMARQFHEVVGTPNARFHNVFYYGNTALLVLDTGEDKPDDTKVYAGINDFDSYRTEQARWLKSVMATRQFRKSKHKIVLMHMPPFECPDTPDNENHGCRQLHDEWLPLLNAAGIDLMLCGHTHFFLFKDKGSVGNEFPIVVNDNHSAVRVAVSGQGIEVRVVNDQGKELMNEIFR